MTQTVEELCRQTYKETSAFYDRVAPELGSNALGFRILYGPPIFEAPALFIGYQPGGLISNDQDHRGWPARCDYADAEWKLAARLREIFSVDQLSRCTGLNAVFFRAPSIEGWRRIPLPLRREIEAFCRHRAERVVSVLNPRQIIIIGLGTFDWLVPAPARNVILTSSENKVLAKEAKLWECPAVGVPHLSGDRIRTADRDRLSEFLRSKVPI